MANLTQASDQLFARPADERFETLSDLARYCQQAKDKGRRYREASTEFQPVHDGVLKLKVNGFGPFRLTDWSFGQCCSLAGVSKDTINRLSPDTATKALTETLHQRADHDLDLQALVHDDQVVRAVNGDKYKRLWNADVISVVQEFATDFTPPQQGVNGATGLYAGEQDCFLFMVDSTGWIEVGDQAFAPGFFLANSEVGARRISLSTFWFQSVCANHIVWDAIDVVEFNRKHTGKVREALTEIRQGIERLVEKRDERQDEFHRVVARAMETRYGTDVEDVASKLAESGFTKTLAKKAAEIAKEQGVLTIFAVVDALTQLSQQTKFAASRTEADQKASALLALATS